MRFVIPQQFNQSDKIGRFTFPQMIILAVMTCIFVLIVIASNFWISIIAFFPLAIITFVLMYFRVNKIPIYEFLMIYIVYIGSPKLLLYRSDNLKSIEEMEEGIGFLEPEKVASKTKNNNSKSEKVENKSKNKPEKKPENKQSKNTNISNHKMKNPPRNQTQKKRDVKQVKNKKDVKR